MTRMLLLLVLLTGCATSKTETKTTFSVASTAVTNKPESTTATVAFEIAKK